MLDLKFPGKRHSDISITLKHSIPVSAFYVRLTCQDCLCSEKLGKLQFLCLVQRAVLFGVQYNKHSLSLRQRLGTGQRKVVAPYKCRKFPMLGVPHLSCNLTAGAAFL